MYAVCARCGAANAAANRYCIYCGAPSNTGRSRSALAVAGFPRRWWFGPAHWFDAARGAVATPRLGAPRWPRATALLAEARAELDFADADWWTPASRKARLAVEVALVALLTILALVLRVWQLGTVPPAPSGDESAIALETLRILSGDWIGIWSGVALGNPSGHMYWLAPFFALGGPTLVMLRLASALPGVALVPICYLLARMLFPFPVAFVATAFVASFSWFVIVYRIGIPVTLSVFVAAASICLLMYAARSSRLWVAIVAGAVCGLGLYAFKGYAIYFMATCGATVLAMLVSRQLRRRHRWILPAFLGAALAAGAFMILFYADTGYLTNNLEAQYTVGGSDLLSLPRHVARFIEVLLYIHIPAEAGAFGFDGIVPKPILHPLIAVFFWIGLVTALLFIDRGRFQLLLLGWLIGMAPAILVPGGETRRYLLGVFFVFLITAVGFVVVLNWIVGRWLIRPDASGRDTGGPDTTGGHDTTGLGTQGRRLAGIPRRRLGYALAVAATGILALSFAVQNVGAFREWTTGQQTRFQFDPEIAAAARFLNAEASDRTARFYSVRWAVNYETVRWFAPELHGVNGSAEFGGDGTIFANGVVTEPTVFMLMGGYHQLIDDLQATYPGGVEQRESDADGKLLYIAYTIDQPPPPGTVQVPPYYRLTPDPESIPFRVNIPVTLALTTNRDDRVRVTLAPDSPDAPGFALSGGNCPSPGETSALVGVAEMVNVTACGPGRGEIRLSLEGDDTAVQTYRVTAPDPSRRTPADGGEQTAIVEPDPSQLAIQVAPTRHHELTLVTTTSVLIVPSPGDAVIIHNDADLQGRDGCAAVERRPEGDTRLSIILEESGQEIRSPFYVVGCAAGPVALELVSGDTTLGAYTFTVEEPP